MPKIRVHPTFFVLILLMLLAGKTVETVLSFSAVLLHEAAHALAARARGYETGRITLLPYGAMLGIPDETDDTSMVLIAAAGPISNFLTCLLTISLWWIFPATYSFTKPFYEANLTIGLFNLLPAYPLDGARIFLGLSRKPHRALKRLKISGIVVSAVLIVLFISSAALGRVNLTLGIMGVFLFIGAFFGQKKEAASLMLKSNPLLKNYLSGVRRETYVLSPKTTLSRAVKLSGAEKELSYVVNVSGKEYFISEERLFSYLKTYSLSDTLEKVISSEQSARRF